MQHGSFPVAEVREVRTRNARFMLRGLFVDVFFSQQSTESDFGHSLALLIRPPLSSEPGSLLKTYRRLTCLWNQYSSSVFPPALASLSTSLERRIQKRQGSLKRPSLKDDSIPSFYSSTLFFSRRGYLSLRAHRTGAFHVMRLFCMPGVSCMHPSRKTYKLLLAYYVIS